MILLGILLLAFGILIFVISLLISLGHLNLLLDYHRKNVKKENEKSFCLTVGLSIMISGIGMIIGGLISIILNKDNYLYVPLIILFVSLIISIIMTLGYIKKYNGKIMA